MPLLSKTEIYRKVRNAVDEQLKGTHITKAPKDFPVKKTMYYNISAFLSGSLSYEKLLYSDEKLQDVCRALGVCENIERQTFFNIS